MTLGGDLAGASPSWRPADSEELSLHPSTPARPPHLAAVLSALAGAIVLIIGVGVLEALFVSTPVTHVQAIRTVTHEVADALNSGDEQLYLERICEAKHPVRGGEPMPPPLVADLRLEVGDISDIMVDGRTATAVVQTKLSDETAYTTETTNYAFEDGRWKLCE